MADVASSAPAPAAGPDRYRLGGCLVRSPVCFTPDEKTFFCCSGSVVKVFSVQTHALLGVLEGHVARVTAVLVNPNNALQVFTASHDGTVRLWDYLECSTLQVFQIGQPILHAVISGSTIYMNVDPLHYSRIRHRKSTESTSTFSGPAESTSATLSSPALPASASASATPEPSVATCQVLSFHTVTRETRMLFKSGACLGLAVSPLNEFVAAIADKELSLYHVARQTRVRLVHPRPLTALAFHPSEPVLATGDESGRVTLWMQFPAAFDALPAASSSAASSSSSASSHASDLPPALSVSSGAGTNGSNGSGVVTTDLHWHAHAVSALSFSEDGSYLLSGGEEAVLVFWQLHTSQRQFIPHLGAPLVHITTSPGGHLYGVACADNSVRMISAVSNKVVHFIQGLQHATSNMLLYGDDLYSGAPSAAAAALAAAKKQQQSQQQQQQKQSGKHDSQKQGAGRNTATKGSSQGAGKGSGAGAGVGAGAASGKALAFQHSLTRAQRGLDTLSTGLVPDPATGYIVLAGKVGHLQVFDVAVDRHVASLAVVDRNHVSRREREEEPVVRVNQAAFSADGVWLATVDRWADGLTSERVSLKIWRRVAAPVISAAAAAASGAASGSGVPCFQLNTRTEAPHNGQVTSVAFHPSLPLLVTASDDNTFKLWSPEELRLPGSSGTPGSSSSSSAKAAGAQQVVTRVAWGCRGTGQYRDQPIHATAFSADGSLLAVAFGQIVTLWNTDPASLTLHSTLLHPPPVALVRFLRFLPNSPYLVVGTQSGIYVWNVVSASVAWSLQLPLAALAAHPSLPYFAALVVLPKGVDPGPSVTASITANGSASTSGPAASDSSSVPEVLSGSRKRRKPEPASASVSSSTPSSSSSSSASSVPAGASSAGASSADRSPTDSDVGRPSCTLLVFHGDSSTPIRVVDASDARIETQVRPDCPAAHATTHTGSLTFLVPPASSAGASSGASLLYLNRYKELIRIPRALSSSNADYSTAAVLLGADTDADARIAALRASAAHAPNIFSHLFIHSAPSSTSTASSSSSASTEASSAAQTPAALGAASQRQGLHEVLAAFLETPPHVLGPLSLVFPTFMHVFLRKRVKVDPLPAALPA